MSLLSIGATYRKRELFVSVLDWVTFNLWTRCNAVLINLFDIVWPKCRTWEFGDLNYKHEKDPMCTDFIPQGNSPGYLLLDNTNLKPHLRIIYISSMKRLFNYLFLWHILVASNVLIINGNLTSYGWLIE